MRRIYTCVLGIPHLGDIPPLFPATLAAAAPNYTLNQDGLLRTARIFIPQCPTESREVPSEETQVTVQLTEFLSFLSKTVSLSFG